MQVRWAVPAVVALLGSVGAARAQGPEARDTSASTSRLSLFSRAELTQLEPFLAQGPIAFVEFAERPALPGVVLATEVNAPASQVAALIGDPARYPDFMPALDSVQIRARRGHSVAYEWSWQTAIFTLTGHSVLTTYPTTAAHRHRGYRLVVRNTGGDLGHGRMLYRVYPRGEDRSLIVLSSRLDLRDANYVTRQLDRARA